MVIRIVDLNYKRFPKTRKSVVLVHPNPDILNQLEIALIQEGHIVGAFTRVQDANRQIHKMSENSIPLDKIIVPANLKVAYNLTYKSFLNRIFPKYQVITIDERDYRDSVNIKLDKNEYLNSLFKNRYRIGGRNVI